MSLRTGHRIALRDGTQWSVLDVDWKHRLVRLGDNVERPHRLKAVSFREVREILGWDDGKSGIHPIHEDEGDNIEHHD